MNYPKSVKRALLTENLGVGAPLEAPTIRLFSNDFSPSENSVVGDFTECAFTGYAAVAGATWGTVGDDVDGSVYVSTDSAEFKSTGSAVQENAYGWYLTDAAGTALYAFQRFDEPVYFADLGDVLTLVPKITLPWGI